MVRSGHGDTMEMANWVMGRLPSRSTPVQVSGLSGVVALAGGGTRYSLALKSDGTVWAWGYNVVGQLGRRYVRTIDQLLYR